MTTRVLHIRLPEADIARCYMLLNAAGIEDADTPGPVVARALQLLLEPLAIEPGPQPSTRIQESMDKIGAQEPDFVIEPQAEDNLAVPPPATPLTEAPPTKEAPPSVPDSPPWEGHNLIPFRIIADECPKDRFVEAVLEPEEPDSYLVRAVEIAYAVLGRDLWGSQKAGEIIAMLLEKFHHYTEQTGEEL